MDLTFTLTSKRAFTFVSFFLRKNIPHFALSKLSWRNRDRNTEADALTNLDFQLFDPKLRQVVNPKDMKWRILSELEKDAQALYDGLKDIKSKGISSSKNTAVTHRFAKRSAKTRLKFKDPW